RPWITLPPCQSDTIVNTQATICSPRNPTSTTVHVRPKQVFTISEMRSVRHYNWEQDLGLQGLQQSKKKYEPCHFLKKFTVSAA
ncbi:MAG: hypothetical protein Q8O52_27205, partial [Sulfuritalea sp.]|nr:hypothetical protein [Sulfuritalea sp.]